MSATRLLCAIAAACGLASPALADTHSAEACRSALSPAGQMIYDEALAQNINVADGTAVITKIAEKLIAEGKLKMADARADGEAAGKCLEMLE